ncbi:MAG: hypothetical protein BYD32DRAFT_408546 [Podila humilis]|nr:MAG: hypothetical protein BYD32DRAFT_408546 [Podila humilis]
MTCLAVLVACVWSRQVEEAQWIDGVMIMWMPTTHPADFWFSLCSSLSASLGLFIVFMSVTLISHRHRQRISID